MVDKVNNIISGSPDPVQEAINSFIEGTTVDSSLASSSGGPLNSHGFSDIATTNSTSTEYIIL